MCSRERYEEVKRKIAISVASSKLEGIEELAFDGGLLSDFEGYLYFNSMI
jgi:hypothetical protein